MRIISGTSKGRKIFSPNDNITRPLKDLTKESIFNIIKHSNLLKLKIENSNILDLFSGVGSFGLECLSSPKDPTPENKSRILEFSRVMSSNLECLIILKIDSLVRSLRGLVNLSLGGRIFLPLKFPEIILIHQLPYSQYLF